MKHFLLPATALALALLVQSACAQPQPAPAGEAPKAVRQTPMSGPHFIDMTTTPVVFVRIPNDPDAATIWLDIAAIEAVKPDMDPVIQVKVGYDMDHPAARRAETGLDPQFETILASTGAHARLLATSTTAYERDYWFAPDDDSALVTALRHIPQPDGAAIAVIRSNRGTLNDLKPTEAELAAGKAGTAP